MNETVGYNVHNTVAHAARSMAYFERHNLYDIYREVIVRAARDRPDADQVKEYLAQAMLEIKRPTWTTVLAPPIFNAHCMSREYSRKFKTPIVQYTKQRQPNDAAIVLRKFREFVRKHCLQDKHLIAFNFPASRGEAIECIADAGFAPDNVLEIVPDTQIPYKTRLQLQHEKSPYLDDFQQVETFFAARSADLHFGDVTSKKSRRSVARTMSDVCQHVQRVVRQPIMGNLADHRFEQRDVLSGGWYARILLIGRRGSGRKTQAALLAKRLGLVFVDVDFLVLQQIQSSDKQLGAILASREKRHNRCGDPFVVGLVQKRISQPDCLHNGYVVVGFATCVEDLRLMDKHFVVRPNRIIFLHCRERECQRRLRRQIERQEALAGGPAGPYSRAAYQNPRRARHTCAGVHLMMEPAEAYRCIEKEHIHYNMNVRDMVAYVGCQREVRHVNGTRSVRTVHESMLSCACRMELEIRGADV